VRRSDRANDREAKSSPTAIGATIAIEPVEWRE
jgi:hypothetical protein